MSFDKSIDEIKNLFTDFWEVDNRNSIYNTIYAYAVSDCIDVQNMKKYSDKVDFAVIGFVIIETDLKVSYKYATEILESIDFTRADEDLREARAILEYVVDGISDIYNKLCKWPTNKEAEIHYALGIEPKLRNWDDAETRVCIPLDGFDL